LRTVRDPNALFPIPFQFVNRKAARGERRAPLAFRVPMASALHRMCRLLPTPGGGAVFVVFENVDSPAALLAVIAKKNIPPGLVIEP
jgi:hypothetical protein